ncbi:MAG: CDP-alcohol phosphatidyltransferase family protein, partial [Candidatus Altiarchaeota archaeon]|nr:CDP-alcohol phosphatidyltransferase family protein [Candidatus Altiarchaeota archaeon]
RKYINYDWRIFGILGILPQNVWTSFTLIFSIFSAVAYYHGQFFTGAVFLLLTGLSDTIDGGVARHFNSKTKFGAILDATIDRIGEGLVLVGIMNHFKIAGIALVLSFAVSYIRAKDDRIITGIAERGERILLLATASVFGFLETGLYILMAAALTTVIMRLREAKKLNG